MCIIITCSLHVLYYWTDRNKRQRRLCIAWHKSGFPRPAISEVYVIQSHQPLVVVPVGNDVHCTGDHNHPCYGFVEGKVLVQQPLHLSWRTLQEQKKNLLHQNNASLSISERKTLCAQRSQNCLSIITIQGRQMVLKILCSLETILINCVSPCVIISYPFITQFHIDITLDNLTIIIGPTWWTKLINNQVGLSL